jgi:type II secretory pathway component PulK
MRNYFKKRESESGVILLVVLIVIAILTTLVVDFIYFTQVNTEVSANTRDEMKAHYIAKSGVYVATGTIKNQAIEQLSAITSITNDLSGISTGYWSIKIPSSPVGDGVVSVTVIDERSKINLNALVNQATNQVDSQVRVELTELFRMVGVDNGKSSRFISSLINWLDHPIEGLEGNDQDPNGANAQFYAQLASPYQIKDGPLDSLGEIRMIDGMDDDFFNKINDYVTVYPADKRVNFSTAPEVVMIAAIKGAGVSAIHSSGGNVPDDIAQNVAKAVIDARKDNPIINQAKVRQIVQKENTDPTIPIAAGLSGVVLNTGQSDVFSVMSTGIIGQVDPIVRIINAVVRKTISGNSQGVKIISWKER